jgi:hypothetical protein
LQRLHHTDHPNACCLVDEPSVQSLSVASLAGESFARLWPVARPSTGTKPSLLKVELVLNLKTAKALGITCQLPLLGRANELIE